ncbi:sulfite oxidase [Arthrobacter cavernae]|uniref:Sulfite oxidase n=1 Tax=Arthrobacter cavernae TaxID=2817681 RepID=A0A939HCG1_9MICC|nr:sulfite oxidase [Arthrobacter cavernae]MBO1268299.1 sulfite oxidase [Arthrobacter cavernae]
MSRYQLKHRHRSTAATQASPHAGGPSSGPLTSEELQLAGRNHSMPLEALREDITPAGLHYILTHFDIPHIDAETWSLRIGGAVSREIELSLDDIMARPAVTTPVTLECAGNGRSLLKPRPLSTPWVLGAVGTASWTGTPLAPILASSGLADDAVELVFTGADYGIQGGTEEPFARSLTVAEAMRPEVMLVYGMNGSPLPPQHGFPLRLLVPGWYGMASVKWLASIEAVTGRFEGFQQAVAYHYLQGPEGPGLPVTRIRVRSLMVPPGIPDFFTRKRVVEAGPVMLRGRAWSGHGEIERVEVGIDGEWMPANLDPPAGDFAWSGWSMVWLATPGEHELRCRAMDSSGALQQTTQVWNYQGMGNNMAQLVHVTVR